MDLGVTNANGIAIAVRPVCHRDGFAEASIVKFVRRFSGKFVWMLLTRLLSAMLATAPPVSMNCADGGASLAAIQTQTVRGPSGMAAILRVSSSDDHSKNDHLCAAEYRLLVTRSEKSDPLAVDLLTSDDDYGRSLTLLLDRFSHDGKRIFGVFFEGGKHPAATLFDYNTSNGKVQLVDLRKQFGQTLNAKCNTTFEVIGTTEAGAIVLELGSPQRCGPTGGGCSISRAVNHARCRKAPLFGVSISRATVNRDSIQRLMSRWLWRH
jgi:hypothetical protein